ncbi:hypothetical protein [Microcoleus vaginatus]|uniref:hypothetical protein n=1 Tax=Microcoleus vaginatus TaxID=119532 RepID=UPI001F6170F1|nr:hypothetical protein D0A37_21990 [Microcoleus vaginatus HSN003]
MAGEKHYIRGCTGKPLLLIHSLARSWRSGHPILNELAAKQDQLAYEELRKARRWVRSHIPSRSVGTSNLFVGGHGCVDRTFPRQTQQSNQYRNHNIG